MLLSGEISMLKAMRTGAQSIVIKLVLFGLLLMAMAGLAVMDVQGMFRSGVSNTTIATIGGDKITATQFEHTVSAALREKNIPQAVANKTGIPQQILSQEINSRMFAKAAADFGLIADDAAAAANIKSILQPLVQQGLSERDALNRLLTNSGLSEAALVATIKQQIATDTLLKLISSGARAPQQMVDDALKFKYESRRGEYFKLNAADIGKVPAPSDSELKDYYKTISARFALPETRSFSLLILDRKSLGIDQKESEETLKKYYQEHTADYTTPETRVVAQVIVPDEPAAKALYDASLKTKDLQKAATGKGATFIKAQTFAEKDMPVELSPTAFQGKEGDILPPVKSPLGWHILFVKKINPGTVKSYDSVKGNIEKELTADKSAEALYEQANKIDDMLAGGKGLDDVAQQFNLKPLVLENLDANGIDVSEKKFGTALPAFDKVLEQAFRLEKGTTGPLIEAHSGEFLIVSVKDIFPAQEQPLERMRGAVLESWKQKQADDLLDRQAAKITERLKLGESFNKIAASFKKTAAATGFVTRDMDPAKEKLDRGFIPALFSLEKTGDATSIAGNDSITILRLTARRIDMPKAPPKEETASLESTLNRSLKNDILEQYRASLVARYNVTINDSLLHDMFKSQEDESGAE
jgi:peptidyl-prolyl cis-trans isomerase D